MEGYHSSNLDLTSPESVDQLCEVLDDTTTLIVAARSRRTVDRLLSFCDDTAIAANVARALYRQPVRKCLCLSSLSVYGEISTNLSITEETAVAPTSPYGTAKFASEAVLRQAGVQALIPTVILRPCMLFGPGDTSRAYGPTRFIRSILSGEKVRLFGDGSELRDYLFIEDFVNIAVQLALNDHCGTFNVGSGYSHSFGEIVTYLREIADREFDVIQDTRRAAQVDLQIDPTKLLAALPGLRFTPLQEGLSETYDHFYTTYSQDSSNG